jgi:hypothetical protein
MGGRAEGVGEGARSSDVMVCFVCCLVEIAKVARGERK